MDSSSILELIIEELQSKQQAVNHQLLILTGTNMPTEPETTLKRQRSIDKVTAQLNALNWAEKCVRDHLNATGKLGKLDRKGHKNTLYLKKPPHIDDKEWDIECQKIEEGFRETE